MSKRKGNLSFGAGFVAGVFIGYYLVSPEGRQLRRSIRTKVMDLGEDLEDKLQQSVTGAIAEFGAAVNLGMHLVQTPHLKEAASETQKTEPSSYKSPVDEVRDNFVLGLEKARQRIITEEQTRKRS